MPRKKRSQIVFPQRVALAKQEIRTGLLEGREDEPYFVVKKGKTLVLVKESKLMKSKNGKLFKRKKHFRRRR